MEIGKVWQRWMNGPWKWSAIKSEGSGVMQPNCQSLSNTWELRQFPGGRNRLDCHHRTIHPNCDRLGGGGEATLGFRTAIIAKKQIKEKKKTPLTPIHFFFNFKERKKNHLNLTRWSMKSNRKLNRQKKEFSLNENWQWWRLGAWR